MNKILLGFILIVFVPSVTIGVTLRDRAPLSRLKKLGYFSELSFKNDDFTKGLIEDIKKEQGLGLELEVIKLEKTKDQLNLTYKISSQTDDMYVPAVNSKVKQCQAQINAHRMDYELSVKEGNPKADRWDLRVNVLQLLYQYKRDLYVVQELSLACVTGSLLAYPGREYHLQKGGEYEVHTTNLLAGNEYESVSLSEDGIEKIFFVVNYTEASDILDLAQKVDREGFYENESGEYWHIEFLEKNNGENMLIYNSGKETEKTAIIEIPLDQAVEVPIPRRPGWIEHIRALQKRVWARRR